MNRYLPSLALFALVLAIVSGPRASNACFPVGPDLFQVATVGALSPIGPHVTELRVDYVTRGEENSGGCSRRSTSCDGTGSIALRLSAKGEGEVGYMLAATRGRLPAGLDIDPRPLRARAGFMIVSWPDGVESPDPFSFTLTVTPIDEFGNLGPSAAIDISG